ncbi:MAG: sugar ABC transporter ATP-binding protein [Christensenellaceae bacterium]|nr:sugar ABC transporter ATP-binding protein [Christensenellaceae bacterium]
MKQERTPIMLAKNITKVYPGTTALKDVDFEVFPGCVNVLVGENGAGKSTLMKILAGIEKPTKGEIFLEGKKITLHNTREASDLGVSIIHQELNMFPDMKVSDNMFAGNEISRFGVVDRREQYKKAREVLERLQQDIDPGEIMRNLRVGQQQVVEIAKTMLQKELKVLIMDEPTSSLSQAEVEVLFKLIEDLKAQGIAIIYISHRLEEVIRIGDVITILRDGERVANANISDIDIHWIIEQMVGHTKLSIEKPPYKGEKQELLKVENFCLPRLCGGYTVDHVSFTLHKGEVLGIYGLMGAGRTELVESLMGLHPESSGNIVLDGEPITKPSVCDQIARGMVIVPEDRQKDGLVQTMSIADNATLTSIPRFTHNGVIDKQASRNAVDVVVEEMQVKVADVRHLITSLSGGNQQKVVIGKCVMAKPKVFIMDEPSRGIDVGAKTDIFRLMRGFAADGMGVIFVGSELKELISVCDRILVMSNGLLTADLSGDEITEDALVKASAAALKTGKSA